VGITHSLGPLGLSDFQQQAHLYAPHGSTLRRSSQTGPSWPQQLDSTRHISMQLTAAHSGAHLRLGPLGRSNSKRMPLMPQGSTRWSSKSRPSSPMTAASDPCSGKTWKLHFISIIKSYVWPIFLRPSVTTNC